MSLSTEFTAREEEVTEFTSREEVTQVTPRLHLRAARLVR